MKTTLFTALVAIAAVVIPTEGLAQTIHNPQHRVTLPAINAVHRNPQQRFNEMKARLSMPKQQLREAQMRRATQLVRPMQGTTCVKRVDGRNAQCITSINYIK